MKLTFVGAGSFRVLPEVRELLKLRDIMHGSTVSLYDIDLERAEAMARLIRKTPEAAGMDLTVSATTDVNAAVADADFVQVIACPWSARAHVASCRICTQYGFIGSDNLSLNGAFLAFRGVPLVLDVARRMERLAPHGIMIVFTNPIGLLTAAVNRHTRIPAFGVCAGASNHCYDLSRFMGWDPPRFDWDVEVAGINHMSWILSLRLDGKNFIPTLEAQMERGIDMEPLKRLFYYDHLAFFFPKMVYAYRTLDVLLFSSEGDGLPHLCYYQEAVERGREHLARTDPDESAAARRALADEFIELSKSELSPEFWNEPGKFRVCVGDPKLSTCWPFVKGLKGGEPVHAVASCPNRGAVPGFPDDVVLEHSLTISPDGIRKRGTYELPRAAAGVTRSLVECQTLVADAIALEDAHTFLKGLFAYPMARDLRVVEPFFNDMMACNEAELPAWMKGRRV